MTDSGKRKQAHKRRAAAVAAGTAAAAAMTVGSLFNTADELLGGAEAEAAIATQTAIVERQEAPARLQRPAERLRTFFLRQNAVVRGVLLLPLWAAGKGLIMALSLLWTALSPYWSVILGALANALLLAALFAFAYKALFPEARLGDLLKRKRWLWLLGGALLLAAADAVMKAYWPDYRPIRIFIMLFCGLVVLCTLSFRIFGRKTAQV